MVHEDKTQKMHRIKKIQIMEKRKLKIYEERWLDLKIDWMKIELRNAMHSWHSELY